MKMDAISATIKITWLCLGWTQCFNSS